MTSRRSFIFLILLVVASRIPLFFGGFGADGDAWRNAKSALTLWSEGRYAVSRFPGFPVYEFLQAPIIGLGGSVASNSAALIIFLCSLSLFRSIVLRWKIPNADIIIVSYAFLPILWKNSALTMDYIWGLCGLLLSLRLIMAGRFIPAAIILGIAAGTRITHIAYLLPFYFLFETEDRKRWVIFALVTAAVTILCYVPVLLSENYRMVVFDYAADVRNYSALKRAGFFIYRTIYSIGLLASVFIAAACVMNIKRFPTLLQSRLSLVSISAVVTGMMVFAVLSDEREYLIPVFPFLLVLIAQIVQRKMFIGISLALLSYGIISVDVIEHSVAQPTPSLNFQYGAVVKEIVERKKINRQREQLAAAPVPDSSIVLIGMGPLFWLENPLVRFDRTMDTEFRHDCSKSIRGNEIYFMYALYKPQLDELRSRGFTVYYWDEMKEYLETFIGYRLTDERVLPLKLSD